MKDIEAVISGLEDKIKKLLNLHKNLREENEGLKIEKNELLIKFETLNKKLKETEDKYNALKISKKIETGEKFTDLKWKINEMVREIDKSLELLSK